MWRNRDSFPSLPWIAELLILSWMASPATLRRKPHFDLLYLWSCSFCHYFPESVTTSEGRNVEGLANKELHLTAQLLLHHNRVLCSCLCWTLCSLKSSVHTSIVNSSLSGPSPKTILPWKTPTRAIALDRIDPRSIQARKLIRYVKVVIHRGDVNKYQFTVDPT